MLFTSLNRKDSILCENEWEHKIQDLQKTIKVLILNDFIITIYKNRTLQRELMASFSTITIKLKDGGIKIGLSPWLEFRATFPSTWCSTFFHCGTSLSPSTREIFQKVAESKNDKTVIFLPMHRRRTRSNPIWLMVLPFFLFAVKYCKAK
ncbi:unnamed protein product [Lactuca saligna]|uniref:Uncharacterized protein n=1 Tax=Lactuca saligna TaxID=75948 RepID=A0AA36A368_LACSI|nr:unnamed protein product [Lactuca saligna]